MIKKWQNLYKQLEIFNLEKKSNLEIDIIKFEAQTKIKLPPEYKNFLLVFGTGRFGNYIGLTIPNIEESKEFMGYYLEKLDYESQFWPEDESSKIKKLRDIFNSALLFGNTPFKQDLVWDLRTYNKTDKSYDIYLVMFDCPSAFKVGRNFYEFVCDFCLGLKSHEILPEDSRPEPSSISYTFTHF